MQKASPGKFHDGSLTLTRKARPDTQYLGLILRVACFDLNKRVALDPSALSFLDEHWVSTPLRLCSA
jgi:hypothetical protein